MKKLVIAIDGHASCGKSTTAKAVAKALGYVYVDSGAMYRAVTLFALQKGYIVNEQLNQQALLQALPDISISFEYNMTTAKSETWLNGQNVEQQIRLLDVSKYVSTVSQIREIREKLVDLQQKMGKNGGIAMDGRDIGTVVFPDADIKLFMTASPQVRAQRRYDELLAKGEKPLFDDVLKNVIERDHADSTRTESPLRQAHDAIVLDNSYLNHNEQLEFILNLVYQHHTNYQYADFRGARVRFSDNGQGKPIVLLHGYLESIEIWGEFSRKLSQTHRVICIDLLGHGKSGSVADIHTMDIMADAVQAVVNQLSLPPFVLFGHSMGGYVALAYVRKYQQHVAGWSLFHSSPFADNDERRANRDRQIQIIQQGHRSQILQNHFPNTLATHNVAKLASYIELARQTATTMTDQATIAAIEGMKNRSDGSEFLRTSTMPFLYILGLHDNFIPHTILQNMQLPAHAQTLILEQSGHNGFQEEPHAALEGVLRFVQQCI